jgi:hypothetical protein
MRAARQGRNPSRLWVARVIPRPFCASFSKGTMTALLGRVLASRLVAAWRTDDGSVLSPVRIRELCESLEAEKEALEAFTATTEQEFLTLGTLLRKIASLAREVKGQSDEVIAAAAGRTEDAALQFAFQLLKKAEDLVHASREQHANVFCVFENMHLELRQIAREREVLMRTLSPLESTNTQFRIQACSFDENTRAQFFGLAESIGEIIRDVRTAVGQRFDELERTRQTSGELVAKLTVQTGRQKNETERTLADTRNRLSRLNDALVSSEAAAESISQSGGKIAGGVGKVIVALQTQDMSRQKLEHINSAIDKMIAHLAPGCESGFRGSEAADGRQFLAGAGLVQLGQLRNVFAQLHGAAQEIEQGLAEVESEAKRFAESALQMGAGTLDDQMTGRAIESIHAVLSVIDVAVTSIRDVVHLVQKLKSTFSDCTSQILELAVRLRMVALNAQIFAAHVDGGAALEVVAMNTRTIAEQSMRQLDEISSRVAALVDSVVDLEYRLEDYQELATQEQKLLGTEAAESGKKLSRLEQELRGALAAIGPLEKELSEIIHRATIGIRFPDAVAQASSRSTALFEEIARRYSDAGHGSDAGAHHKVNALKQNYTMAHERIVHDSVVGISLSGTHGLSGEHDEELADNVELF